MIAGRLCFYSSFPRAWYALVTYTTCLVNAAGTIVRYKFSRYKPTVTATALSPIDEMDQRFIFFFSLPAATTCDACVPLFFWNVHLFFSWKEILVNMSIHQKVSNLIEYIGQAGTRHIVWGYRSTIDITNKRLLCRSHKTPADETSLGIVPSATSSRTCAASSSSSSAKGSLERDVFFLVQQLAASHLI